MNHYPHHIGDFNNAISSTSRRPNACATSDSCAICQFQFTFCLICTIFNCTKSGGKNAMSDTPNMTIRLAIVAAGGVKNVSQHFGISKAAVCSWHRKGIVPPENIIELCELGGGRFTPEQMLEAVTATKRKRQACEAGAQ